ncbi:MAG: DUF4147 domain-containing protein, partial [Candidatus Zixiibacteriota bacterium]
MMTSRETAIETLKRNALKIAGSAISAVQPEAAILSHCSLNGEILRVGEREFDLSSYRRVIVVGAGKASGSMARALEQLLQHRIDGGTVATKAGYECPLEKIRVVLSSHPVPDEQSTYAAESALNLCHSLDRKDLLICVISGGASSLWALPAEGVSLTDKMRVFESLLHSGADIHEMNCVRKHLSKIKGGRLAQAAFPADVLTLVISDVVGNNLSSIGSGPTVPDPTTFADALAVIRKYGLEPRLPQSSLRRLHDGERGRIEETPKPTEEFWTNNCVQIVASNQQALQAAQFAAQELGYDVQILTGALVGEAREVGRTLANRAKEERRLVRSSHRPLLLLAGGETTVTIRGNGKGGRNQELVLAA